MVESLQGVDQAPRAIVRIKAIAHTPVKQKPRQRWHFNHDGQALCRVGASSWNTTAIWAVVELAVPK
jgi:hypothetical protein